MTGLALLTELTLMDILVFMAAYATCWGFSILLIRLMTGLAVQDRVTMLELKVRIVMIEGSLV